MKKNDEKYDEVVDFLSKKVCLEEKVNDELDRLGEIRFWIWKLFLLATLPNILNGFHISSYVFLGKTPESYWCEIPSMNGTSWTHEQMLNISSESQDLKRCGIIDYDYKQLGSMNYADALNYSHSLRTRAPTVSCLYHPNGHIKYAQDSSSFVNEWDLVCENSFWRTLVQMILSLGKCIGGSMVGVLSDKYGRKNVFTIGCIMFTTASLVATYSTWYWTFLMARFMLGLAAPSMFYSSFIMMTENISARHRAWTAMAFNMSYALGMLYLAAAASFLPNWRDLQLALTVPSVLLVVILYYFNESPRWLLSKGRTEHAYQLIFDRPATKYSRSILTTREQDVHQTQSPSKGVFFEVSSLYRNTKLRRSTIICNFAFFTVSFSYLATAINAGNLSADPVMYVSATGLVDVLSFSSSIVLLSYVGRKWGCFTYFTLAAVCMLVILVLPKDEKTLVVSIAMVGRLGVSAAYAIVTLYTTELFPTEVRNSAVGVSSMFGHVGSMLAPFVVDFLGNIAWFIPTTVCGASLLLAALMILLNRETSEMKLEDHVVEKMAVGSVG